MTMEEVTTFLGWCTGINVAVFLVAAIATMTIGRWELLMRSEYKTLRSFLFETSDDLIRVRQLVVNVSDYSIVQSWFIH